MLDSYLHVLQSYAFSRTITKPRQPSPALSTILNVSITMQIVPLSYAMGCRFQSEVLSSYKAFGQEVLMHGLGGYQKNSHNKYDFQVT